jgi:nitrogen fixation protein FixH
LLGNGIRVRALLRSADGAIVPPANLRMLVHRPGDDNSAIVTLTPEADNKHAVGFFTPDVPGTWRYRLEATALVDAAYEQSCIVIDRTVPPPP